MNVTRNILIHEGYDEETIDKIMNFEYDGKKIAEWDQIVLDINTIGPDGLPAWFGYQRILNKAVAFAKVAVIFNSVL